MTRRAREKIEGITYPYVEDYLYSLLRPRPQPLKRMEEQAEREGIPIIGPTVAPLLTQVASISGAKEILEIGTAIGYSTIWFATAVKNAKGLVTTIELDARRAKQAEANIREAGMETHVKIIQGDVMKHLHKLKGPYDLVFIDTAKELYGELLDPCIERLKVGGILMADNILWSGLVAEEGLDEVADMMREFNRRLYNDPRLMPVLLPFRDGVAVCQRVH